MRKKLLITGIVLATFLNTYAGGLLTNTNQNVTFLRNPARDASMEIDAAYTNPAGLAFLKKDGFSLSLNNQSAIQTRTITGNFAPFAGFGGSTAKTFEGKVQAFVIPDLQAAYKKGKWAISANIGIVGGGGTLKFDKGLPSFESTVAIVPAFLSHAVPTMGFGGYDLESQMKGTSATWGGQLGISYAFVEHFSAYLGARYNYVDNSYNGFLRNVRLGVGGQLVPAATVVSTINNVNSALAGLVSALTGDKELDCKQSGSGIAPVIGLDYNFNRLNIGAKYEFKTGITVKNKTATNSTGLTGYDDGVNIPYDIPALFAAGIQYDLFPDVTLSAGYHHFFESAAKMADDKQKYINGGTNEFLAGVEYRINRIFLVSYGMQFTRQGESDNYLTDLSFDVNSYSVGLGGAVNLTKNIRLNLAYLFSNYKDWTVNSTDYGNISALTQGNIPATHGTNIFSRKNRAFGIGLDFNF